MVHYQPSFLGLWISTPSSFIYLFLIVPFFRTPYKVYLSLYTGKPRVSPNCEPIYLVILKPESFLSQIPTGHHFIVLDLQGSFFTIAFHLKSCDIFPHFWLKFLKTTYLDWPPTGILRVQCFGQTSLKPPFPISSPFQDIEELLLYFLLLPPHIGSLDGLTVHWFPHTQWFPSLI